MPNKEIVIFGAGGHARSVADVLLSNDPETNLVFIDPNAQAGERILGFDVLKDSDFAPDPARLPEVFVAVGNNAERKHRRESLGQLATVEVVAKDAYIGAGAQIGPGVFIGHEAHIGPLVRIGEGSIINTRALIEHEVQIGSNTQIAPGAIISGRVVIGNNVFIGIGSKIIDGISICDDAIVGASATVVENITLPGTYVGTPARKLVSE